MEKNIEGEIGTIEVHYFRDGLAYRKPYCLNWNKCTETLKELKKRLIEEHNSEMLEWVNEERITQDTKDRRIDIYNKRHWVDISFYSEECYPIL